jgi:hypothetical protein
MRSDICKMKGKSEGSTPGVASGSRNAWCHLIAPGRLMDLLVEFSCAALPTVSALASISNGAHVCHGADTFMFACHGANASFDFCALWSLLSDSRSPIHFAHSFKQQDMREIRNEIHRFLLSCDM